MARIDELDLLGRMANGLGLSVGRVSSRGGSYYEVKDKEEDTDSLYRHEEASCVQAFLQGYEAALKKGADEPA